MGDSFRGRLAIHTGAWQRLTALLEGAVARNKWLCGGSGGGCEWVAPVGVGVPTCFQEAWLWREGERGEVRRGCRVKAGFLLSKTLGRLDSGEGGGQPQQTRKGVALN